MKKAKRVVSILMAALLSMNLMACQGARTSRTEEATEEKSTVESSVEGTIESAKVSTQESTKVSPIESIAEGNIVSTSEVPTEGTGENSFDTELTALEFVEDMKIGWNLGNAFDSSDCTWLSDEMEYESGWCGARTTPELIAKVKEAGFNTVRIPVSWHNHLTDLENYTISEKWLDRVTEVVDDCLDQDMYVIINIHHDNSESFLYPTNRHLDQSVKYVTCIWKQIAAHFRDYDEKLLFAGMNEPRLVGHNNEWWIDPDNADCKEAIACINTLNQVFVDTVRASGGNNASRYLLCPGYDASADGALNPGFVLPKDPVSENDHRIILSVHAYTPYHFALEAPGTDTWSGSNGQDLADMVGFMDQLYSNYVAQGIPVIIDEFGARDKNGNLHARVDFAGCYVAQARARGITCIWWDNNAFTGDGERFGLIDRASLRWVYPEIVEAMMQNAE